MSMLEFLIDNIFVELEGTCVNKSSASQWEQAVPPLLHDLSMYSYETELCGNLLSLK